MFVCTRSLDNVNLNGLPCHITKHVVQGRQITRMHAEEDQYGGDNVTETRPPPVLASPAGGGRRGGSATTRGGLPGFSTARGNAGGHKRTQRGRPSSNCD